MHETAAKNSLFVQCKYNLPIFCGVFTTFKSQCEIPMKTKIVSCCKFVGYNVLVLYTSNIMHAFYIKHDEYWYSISPSTLLCFSEISCRNIPRKFYYMFAYTLIKYPIKWSTEKMISKIAIARVNQQPTINEHNWMYFHRTWNYTQSTLRTCELMQKLLKNFSFSRCCYSRTFFLYHHRFRCNK